jgi:hypothetical protein
MLDTAAWHQCCQGGARFPAGACGPGSRAGPPAPWRSRWPVAVFGRDTVLHLRRDPPLGARGLHRPRRGMISMGPIAGMARSGRGQGLQLACVTTVLDHPGPRRSLPSRTSTSGIILDTLGRPYARVIVPTRTGSG